MKNYLELNDQIKEGLPYFNTYNSINFSNNNKILIDSPIKISNDNSLLTPDINELNKGIDFYKKVRNEINPLLYNYKVNLNTVVENKIEKLEDELYKFNNLIEPLNNKLNELENKILKIESELIESKKSNLEKITNLQNNILNIISKNIKEIKDEMDLKYNEINLSIEKKEELNKKYFEKKEKERKEYFEKQELQNKEYYDKKELQNKEYYDKKELQNKEYYDKKEEKIKEYIDNNLLNIKNTLIEFEKQLSEMKKMDLIEKDLKEINEEIQNMEKNFELYIKNLDDLENDFNINFLSKIEFFDYYNKQNNNLTEFQREYLTRNTFNSVKSINENQNNITNQNKNLSLELKNKIFFIEEMIEEHQKLILSYNEKFKLQEKEIKKIKNVFWQKN